MCLSQADSNTLVALTAHSPPGILSALGMRSLEELETLLGPDAEAVADLRRLFDLAAGYGFADWLVFDASVVRGLAYYTGLWRLQRDDV